MTPKRLALGLLAIISGLGCLFLATSDVHYQDRNCGTAVFTTDPNKLLFETGDPSTDDFEQESLITNCNQLILERRFLSAVPAAICLASVIAGQRLRDRKPAMRGNIFSAGSDHR